ncbi:leucine-rich repeat-containing protein 42 [Thamnophis elegans]|uniref:leucine-rich repeat-containing protein 42 n=1 Tax=Thamnophis elegans TaxID=35005 RepID=UPI00137720C2|nr:leucine-rich repeat-containing protein 42 [Thamnophis elegans]XP_032074965.1 leucine-rich repeat-containing protein 42 [Thamnophis elegans]
MSCYLGAENVPEGEPVYVRENGQLFMINQAAGRGINYTPNSRPSRLFSKEFSVELCVNKENDNGRTDHFIFTYTKEGSLRYSSKSLFSLVLSYIADNINHVDSLNDFPEQIAEKLFYAADARQKFMESKTGLCALQTFTNAYGCLVLQKLCLRNGSLIISEKLEEIKSFQGLTYLDLSCCKLGDDHELLEHVTNESLSSLTHLLLKDNCLSDIGLRRMTARVRVMKRGLENLSVLDLSYNPGITNKGVRCLRPFKKLNYLDLSGTGLRVTKEVIDQIQMLIELVHSKIPLKEFDHSSCKTEGWAEQVILQWKHTVLEVVNSKESIKSRLAAQHFYGKRPRAQGPPESLLEGKQRENSENLQFYKERTETSDNLLPQRDMEMIEELPKRRRIAAEQKKHPLQSELFSFSQTEWDLLNSY